MRERTQAVPRRPAEAAPCLGRTSRRASGCKAVPAPVFDPCAESAAEQAPARGHSDRAPAVRACSLRVLLYSPALPAPADAPTVDPPTPSTALFAASPGARPTIRVLVSASREQQEPSRPARLPK